MKNLKLSGHKSSVQEKKQKTNMGITDNFKMSLSSEMNKAGLPFQDKGPEMMNSIMNSIKSVAETKESDEKKKKTPIIKNKIKKGIADKLVSKTKMKLPIGKLMSIGGKTESKEATGSGSAGSYSGPLFGSMKEEKLKGGKADKKTFQDLVNKNKKKGVDIAVIEKELKKQFNKGKKVEREHTDDIKKAAEIALDHLFEDPKYYDKLEKIEKVETKEATGASSAGAYVTTAAWAPSMKKKDWRGAAKPLYKGGKFVTVKKKCKSFPYCNQGDIKSLKIYENETVKKVISKISKEHNINESIIKAVIQNQIEKKQNKSK